MSSGAITINGSRARNGSPAAAIASGIVFCPEDRKLEGLIQGRSVTENIAISARRHFSPFGLLRLAREAELADRMIDRLGIRTPSRRQQVENLSGGNQQKVVLARWLAEQGTKVLIVDEPTRGIDVGAKREIYEVLYALAREGMAIVMVSSDLPEVMGVSDRILVMREGVISAEFSRAAFGETDILTAALPARTQSSPRLSDA